MWAGRLCIFYALLKVGLAGSQSNPLVSGSSSFSGFHVFFWLFSPSLIVGSGFYWEILFVFVFFFNPFPDLELSDGGSADGENSSDLGFSKWLEGVRGKPGL